MSNNPSPINTYYDDDFPTTDSSISTVRRGMPDYVAPIPGYKYLHSLLDNDFYQELLTAISQEDSNLMDIAYTITKQYNLDYYDGDTSFFYDRINNAISLFGNNRYPTFLLTFFTNQLNTHPIQYQNDFLRNLIKKTCLVRQWQGTTKGYSLLFRLINRRGAVHLKTKYPKASFISPTSEKQYRLIDTTQLSKLLPNGEYFPSSYNIKGSTSIQTISNKIAIWDSGNTWGQPNETWGMPTNEWDQPVGISTYGTGLFLEIGIDQLLKSSPVDSYLMDDALLQAIDTLLPQVQRASDDVQVGSQLSLVASNDHRFNTLSLDINYTHANIKAKFQTFNGRWTDISNVFYIKVGSGGYPDISSYFTSGYPIAQSYSTPPNDLVDTTFTSYIGSNEKDMVNIPNYMYINTTFHPRNFVNYIQNINNIGINGLNTTNLISTNIILPNQSITDGSIDYFFEIKVSPIGSYIYGVYSLFSIGVNADKGTILWDNGSSGFITLTDISSIPSIISQLSVLPTTLLESGWSATVSGTNLILSKIATVNMTSVPALSLGTATDIIFNTPYVDTFINQQVEVYQLYNAIAGVYDAKLRYYNKDINQSISEVTGLRTINGYTSDAFFASNTYFPTTSDKVIVFQPLLEEDLFPSLKVGLLGSWLLDAVSEYPNRPYYKFTIVSTAGLSGNLIWNSDGVDVGVVTLSGGESISDTITLIYNHIPSGWSALSYNSNSVTLVATTSAGATPSLITLTQGTVANIVISNSTGLNNDYLQTTWGTTDNWIPASSVSVTNSLGCLVFTYNNTIPTPIVTKSALSISTVSINKFLIMKAKVSIEGIAIQFIVNGSITISSTLTLTLDFQVYSIPLPTGITITSISIQQTPTAAIGSIITMDWIYIGTKDNRSNNIIDESTNVVSGTNNSNYGNYPTGIVDIGQPTYLLNLEGSGSLNIPLSGGTSLTDLSRFTLSAHISISDVSGSNAFIVSKSTDTLSAGWALQLIPNSGWSGTLLRFTSVRSAIPGVWDLDISPIVSGINQKFHLALTYDPNEVAAPIVYINGISHIVTTNTVPVGTTISDNSCFLSWGGSSTQVVFAKIKLQNMRVWDRILTSIEVVNLNSIEYMRNLALYDSSGNPALVQIYIKDGIMYMKPQYNNDGPLIGNNTPSYQNYTSNNTFSVNQNYSLNNPKGIVSISEVGLFDSNMVMVAYGVFPPIQYDASIHHLSFNLLFQK